MKQAICLSLLTAVLLPVSASAAVTLPDPGDVYDGLPVSQRYDDFFSFSAKLLTEFGFTGFDVPTGVGGLDVVIYTGAAGIDNDPVNGGFVFEDPMPAVEGATSTFTGTWGAGLQPNGPVLVDDLLGYLRYNFGADASIPVFSFDLAEARGQGPDIKLANDFMVYDPVTDTVIESWSIDDINNGVFDPAAHILVHGTIALTGASGTEYEVNNNTGSGRLDFLVYAPTMNLAAYEGLGYEFHIYTDAYELSGSHEEAFISGAFTVRQEPPPPVIPEPASLGLFLMGGLGAFIRRRISS